MLRLGIVVKLAAQKSMNIRTGAHPGLQACILNSAPNVGALGTRHHLFCVFALGCALGLTAPSATAEKREQPYQGFITNPITLADAVNIALNQNLDILRASKTIEAVEGIAIQTRAIVLPRLAATGSYSAAQDSDIDQLRAPGLTYGNSQNWVTQLKVVQSLYEGGRMLSSVRAAKLEKQASMLRYQTVTADTILAVQIAYYEVLSSAEEVLVQEASIELLTRELADTTRRYDAGTVPRFNVLRAEVELANARPKLIAARNRLRIMKNNLANVLGFNIPRELEDIPLTLAGKLDDEPFDMDLSTALSLGLARRTELEALRKEQALRKEDLVSAKAGYLPSLQGFAGYDLHNSMLSQDLTVERHGWIGGAQLAWNIFDGNLTRGRVIEAKANYERSGIDIEDAGRRIELEVRTAYLNLIEARDIIESQKKVIEEGLEAVRLAQARGEAGTGTQLDVLSAQTALTQARTVQVVALRNYDIARARLQRAIGVNSSIATDKANPGNRPVAGTK